MSAPEGQPAPAGSAQANPAERQARKLAASFDAAADDLTRNGPVPSAQARRTLLALYDELNEKKMAG